jgi:hypothetical protein
MICRGQAARVVKSFPERPSAHEDGYALLLVMFFSAMLLLAAATATPNLILQGRREKELEMIWRGKQYERGIGLFYVKNHRLPNSIEELTNSNGSLRFMRKAYKDPMNNEDGSWRLIYVGSAGELIGSTRPAAFFTIAVPGGIRSSSASSESQSASATGGGGAPQLTSAATQAVSNSAEIAPGGEIFGGKIIGVGSKIDKRSIIWWTGAKNYLQFEFVWDPSKYGMGVNPARLSGATPEGPQPQPQSGPQQPQTDQQRFPNAFRNPPDAPSNPQP